MLVDTRLTVARKLSAPLALLIAALAAGPGCNNAYDDLPRVAISGAVTYGGEALKEGTIQFVPDPGNEEKLASGGVIEDGKFAVPRAEGPTPGRYQVMIFGGPAPTAAETGADGGAPGAPAATASKSPTGMIPPRYNMATELTAEVKPDGPNEYTFALEK